MCLKVFVVDFVKHDDDHTIDDAADIRLIEIDVVFDVDHNDLKMKTASLKCLNS
jgi:hypothetical protein